jgi:hypothetical protein
MLVHITIMVLSLIAIPLMLAPTIITYMVSESFVLAGVVFVLTYSALGATADRIKKS